jgi:transposase-like protein
MLLHKLRRAMVNVAREPLYGEIEVDETWVGGGQAGLRGSRQLKGRRAALVLVAVEKRGRGSGRVRMKVIPDFKSKTIIPFLNQNVSPGSTIYTDGLKSFEGLTEAGFKHIPRTQPLRSELRKGAKSAVPRADRAIGNLQQWLIGTYHGVSKSQLQVYLDEFVFRQQPPQNARSRLSDPARTRNWSEISRVRADPRSEGSQSQPMGVRLANQISRRRLFMEVTSSHPITGSFGIAPESQAPITGSFGIAPESQAPMSG